jgi:SynChlorMet cassette radical SAM/SPASM protein ScmE
MKNSMKVMKTPKSIDLAINSDCNLRCTYCAHFESAGDVKQDLTTEEWLTFFEELNRCAVMNVCIQGGEPFYRKDLKELIDGIIRNRMRFRILSNGTLITDEMSAFLSSTGRCDSVQVSIDGSIPATHDACRGDGNFLRAIEGIKYLQKHKVSVKARVTIHKHNVRDLENIAKLLLEEIGLPGFSTNAASYMGLCRQNTNQIQLTIEERSIAMESLLNLNKRYDDCISANAGPLADARQWIRMEKALRDGKEFLPGYGSLTGCGCISENLAVRADGVIVPCILLSHIELGMVNKDDLVEVWQRNIEMNNLRNRHSISLDDFEFCKECEYADYCTGNCPALAYTTAGTVNHPSPDACLKRFLAAGGRLPPEIED